MLPSLSEQLTQDHRDCDRDWAEVESERDPVAFRAAFGRFRARTLSHLDLEERVLFPAFEAATGMRGGPTEVMRLEHQRMRALLEQMQDALDAGDRDAVLDEGDTLLMMTQQHNVKEEQVLYPMMTQHLADQWPRLRARAAS